MIGNSFPGAMSLESHQDHLGRVSIYLIDVYNHLKIFQHILKIQSIGIFRESEYPFLRDARGEIPGPCTFILAYSLTVPTPTVSLDHEFFLKELFFYRYNGIASETTLLIRFRLVMRFRRTLQDPGLSMCKWDNPSFTFQQCLQSLLSLEYGRNMV
ncbi:hypothetical protein L1887_32262 [Cichorium endivia]|nr:hypothetical protein L1887_32262 [Cichorium endivia]